MSIRFLDEPTGVELQPFGSKPGSLFSRHRRRHVWADPAFRSHHAMPRQLSSFFIGKTAEHEGDVASGDIHVNGEASIGCELSRWNERYQTEDFRTDPGKRDGFRPGHVDCQCRCRTCHCKPQVFLCERHRLNIAVLGHSLAPFEGDYVIKQPSRELP